MYNLDISKYTQKSHEAIIKAQSIAVGRHHQEVTSRHLLYSLLIQKEGIIEDIVQKSGTNINLVKSFAEEIIQHIPSVHGHDGSLTINPGLTRVLIRAEKEAENMKDKYISVEHL